MHHVFMLIVMNQRKVTMGSDRIAAAYNTLEQVRGNGVKDPSGGIGLRSEPSGRVHL